MNATIDARKLRFAALLAICLFACTPAHAQQAQPGAPAAAPGDDTAGQSASDLAKKLLNPIGDLYSFPFQNNANIGAGPHGGVPDILNIQPVIPIHVNDDYNVITRTILPVVWNPDLSPLPSVPVGTRADHLLGLARMSTIFSDAPRGRFRGWRLERWTGPSAARRGSLLLNTVLLASAWMKRRAFTPEPRRHCEFLRSRRAASFERRYPPSLTVRDRLASADPDMTET